MQPPKPRSGEQSKAGSTLAVPLWRRERAEAWQPRHRRPPSARRVHGRLLSVGAGQRAGPGWVLAPGPWQGQGCEGSPGTAHHESTPHEGPGSGCWACAYPLPVTPRPDHGGAGHVLHPVVWCGLRPREPHPGPALPALQPASHRAPIPAALDTPGHSGARGRVSWVGLSGLALGADLPCSCRNCSASFWNTLETWL